MRWLGLPLAILGGAVLLTLLAGGTGGDRIGLAIITDGIQPGVTCPTNPDNGAYKLDRWKIADTLSYKVNAPSDFVSAINSAFDTWEATALGNKFTYAGTTDVATVALDGTNAVFFAPLSNGTIAAAYVWYYLFSKEVAHFDIVFNSNYDWDNLSGDGDCVESSAFDVQDIATHEVGHVVGVAHTSPNGANNAQSMYPYGQAGEIYKRTLASGDIAGANEKYGSGGENGGGGPPPCKGPNKNDPGC